MTPSKKVFVFAVSVVSALSASPALADLSANVLKSDGTVRSYKLLPIHHDFAHARIVRNRMMRLSRERADLPAQYEISHEALPPIRDQGNRGTCAYFATVGILEAHYMLNSSTFANRRISEECLVDVRNWMADNSDTYTVGDQPDMRPDPNGDLPQSIIKTISLYGVPEAKAYSDKVDCSYNGANEDGLDLAIDDYKGIFSQNLSPAFGKDVEFDYNSAPTLDTVKALIAADIPVEVGLTVYNEYLYGYDWRFDPEQDNDWNLAGGHAIILTGYKTEGGKTIFTFKNSWGKDWGHEGFGTIDDALLLNSWAFDPAFDMSVSVKN